MQLLEATSPFWDYFFVLKPRGSTNSIFGLGASTGRSPFSKTDPKLGALLLTNISKCFIPNNFPREFDEGHFWV